MSKPALELYAREQKAPKMEIPPGRDFKTLSFQVEPDVELELRKLKGKGETFNDVMKKLLAMVPKKKGEIAQNKAIEIASGSCPKTTCRFS